MKSQSSLEQRLSTISVVDQVVNILELAILNGEIKSGAKLSEQAIADRMGISRGPLREALRRLEGRGLIEREPHIGARVTPLLKEKLEEILLIRESLESLACRLAAENITSEEIKSLEAILKRKSLRTATERNYHESSDQDFHLAIIMASGNQKLIRILRDDIYYLMRFHRYRSGGQPGRLGKISGEHQAILDAIKSGSPDEAEAAMRRHLQQAHSSIRKSLNT